MRKLTTLVLISTVLIGQSFRDRSFGQASPASPPNQSSEDYQKVQDWSKAGIHINLQVTDFTRDSAGNCVDIGGRVTVFKIGPRDSPLISKETIKENGVNFIVSKDLGKIKVGCGDLPYVFSLWLTSSQRDKLATLKAEAENTKEYKDALQAAVAKSLDLVLIQPGEFVMGSPEDEKGHQPNEISHKVKITHAFEIAKYEVTQGLWETVMGSNPSSHFACGLDCPVETVSWTEVQAFIAELNRKYPGKEYRLPTEAEWEFAARAGNGKPLYGEIDAIEWYAGNSRGSTHPVGQKKPNAWGLFDMLGNVWEFCSDWYGPYPTDGVTDPTGPPSGPGRVIRGGSYISVKGREPYIETKNGVSQQKYYPEGRSLRAAFRDYDDAYSGNIAGGFRLARSVAGEH